MESQEILNESMKMIKTSDNLEQLKSEHATRTKGRYSYYDKAPTKATHEEGVIKEVETGMPVAKYKKNSFGGHEFQWHPTFAAIHPGISNSYRHGTLGWDKFLEKPQISATGVRSSKPLKTKGDIENRVQHLLDLAHADNFHDHVKITKEQTGSIEGGDHTTNMHVHDYDTGKHLFSVHSIQNPNQYGTHDHKHSVTYNSEFIKEHGLTDEEVEQHKTSVLSTEGFSKYTDSIDPINVVRLGENYLKTASQTRPFAVGIRKNSNTGSDKEYKAVGADHEVSSKHEDQLKTQGFNIHRHSPTAFMALKGDEVRHSVVHDGKLHVAGDRYRDYQNTESLR